MMKKVLILFGVLAVLLAGVYLYGRHEATKPPDNSPGQFLRQKPGGGKVVVCIGDSITHGRVSCNYVDILSRKLGSKGYRVVNAGINSELAYNVTLRLDEILRCKPDFVTVLIGTNDANASLSEKNTIRAMGEMKLPQKPTEAWYRRNLEKLCTVLKKNTGAKIALLSLPPIGEEPENPAYLRAKRYSAVIKDVSARQKLAYLPLNETMDGYLRERGGKPLAVYDEDWILPMYKAIAKHVLLGKSYNEISRSIGFHLLSDMLHLNCTGAEITADMIDGFIAAR